MTLKQREDESLKVYLAKFNKKQMATDDQNKKITLAALLRGVWPWNPFMEELARKTPKTLRESWIEQMNSFTLRTHSGP